MKVRPVINAVTLLGSSIGDVSIPVTSKSLTPLAGRRIACWPEFAGG
jgi:hypothetical protein